jgi:outer membrane protein TolC/preprotein translocase subunit SecF
VKGVPTALGDVARLSTQRLASDIVTENGQLQVRVTANVDRASLSTVVAGIRQRLRAFAFPPGYGATIGGQAASQARSFSQFAAVIAIAIALVYAVMLAAFRSFRLPLAVLTAIPLALIGVALGLAVTGTPINVSSFMGLLLLVGLVVKNGILLIDAANRRRAEGDGVVDALVAAGRMRLRPIVMTTLAAIGGLLPLAFGLGQGAEMERPLAIAVIGGLSTATVFTLIVIPVLYVVFAGARRPAGAVVASALLLAAACLGTSSGASAQEAPATLPAFAGLSLEAAVTDALTASPDVLAARARVAQSRAVYAEARGGAAPSLVTTYAQTPQGNPPGPNVVSRTASAQLQFSLTDLLGLAPAARAAALTLASSDADEAAAETAERVRTIGLYYDALKARGIVEARRSALALASAQRDAANVRVTAGDAPRLDIVRADVAVAQAQADLESATAADANATDALLTETGATASAVASTVERPAPVANPALDDPVAVASLARVQRTEVRSASLAAQAALASVDAARAAGTPAIVVSGGYLTGTDSGVPVNAPTIDASVTIPLSGVARARVDEARAKADEARAKAAGVERTVVLEATAASRTLGAAERAAAATIRARDAAERALQATELGYRSGATSSLDLAAARVAYAQALVDEIAARFEVAKARATLAAEIGA